MLEVEGMSVHDARQKIVVKMTYWHLHESSPEIVQVSMCKASSKFHDSLQSQERMLSPFRKCIASIKYEKNNYLYSQPAFSPFEVLLMYNVEAYYRQAGEERDPNRQTKRIWCLNFPVLLKI